jgi:ectoine hydroxylase-related dioxygenase (phytanoyl-CoA dioxygenase family)
MQERGVDLPEPVAIEMPAGGVTFHHGCNFHYAGPNHSEQPRRAFAIIYIPNYVMFTSPKRFGVEVIEVEEHALHPILADGST